jgi:predicted RNA-binding Zn-ribbon protein involved in translation (DUF1610 family)
MTKKTRFLSAEINLADVFKTETTKCPTCGGDTIERTGQLAAVYRTINAFYLALDRGENALIFQNKAFREIENLLGLHWESGAMTEHLRKHSKLKEMYEQQLEELRR